MPLVKFALGARQYFVATEQVAYLKDLGSSTEIGLVGGHTIKVDSTITDVWARVQGRPGAPLAPHFFGRSSVRVIFIEAERLSYEVRKLLAHHSQQGPRCPIFGRPHSVFPGIAVAARSARVCPTMHAAAPIRHGMRAAGMPRSRLRAANIIRLYFIRVHGIVRAFFAHPCPPVLTVPAITACPPALT